MNKHKAMRIADRIYQNNKRLFVTVNTRNVCKLEFSDYLWLPFHDQPQSYVVVFEITYFYIYTNITTKRKHGISTNDRIKLNENVENFSIAII